jgi:hypothetical protein
MNQVRLFVLVASFALGCPVAALGASPLDCDKLKQTLIRGPEDAASAVPNVDHVVGACRKNVVSASSLESVWKRMVSRNVAGTKRLDKPIPAGMPSGLVLPERGAVVFDLRAVMAEGPLAPRDEGPGVRTVVSPLPAAGMVAVPAAGMAPGSDYRWTLTTSRGESYSAQISVPDTTAQQEVQTRLSEIARLGVDDTTRLFLQAAVLDDADFDSASDLLVRDVRQRTGH